MKKETGVQEILLIIGFIGIFFITCLLVTYITGFCIYNVFESENAWGNPIYSQNYSCWGQERFNENPAHLAVHVGYKYSTQSNDTLTFYFWNISDYIIGVRYDANGDLFWDFYKTYNVSVIVSPTMYVITEPEIINPVILIDAGYTLQYCEFVTLLSNKQFS